MFEYEKISQEKIYTKTLLTARAVVTEELVDFLKSQGTFFGIEGKWAKLRLPDTGEITIYCPDAFEAGKRVVIKFQIHSFGEIRTKRVIIKDYDTEANDYLAMDIGEIVIKAARWLGACEQEIKKIKEIFFEKEEKEQKERVVKKAVKAVK